MLFRDAAILCGVPNRYIRLHEGGLFRLPPSYDQGCDGLCGEGLLAFCETTLPLPLSGSESFRRRGVRGALNTVATQQFSEECHQRERASDYP